jgi:DNA-binding Lrp family transcriptional regulator
VLKTKKEFRDALQDYLKHHKSINTVYRVNSGFDFMVEAVFRDLKEGNDFIEELSEKFEIEQSHTLHIIEEIKKEGFLE